MHNLKEHSLIWFSIQRYMVEISNNFMSKMEESKHIELENFKDFLTLMEQFEFDEVEVDFKSMRDKLEGHVKKLEENFEQMGEGVKRSKKIKNPSVFSFPSDFGRQELPKQRAADWEVSRSGYASVAEWMSP